jgi:hypothetical protein
MSKKEYPATVASLWKRGFTFNSMPIDARSFDQIREVLAKAEIGGQLTLRTTSPRTKEEKGDKFPDAFLEYLTPQQVADEKRRYDEYKNKQGGGL